MPGHQPKETVEKIYQVLKCLNDWQFGVLAYITDISKSLLIGLSMIEQQLSGKEAAEAANLESNYQTQFWGEMKESHDVEKAYLKMCLTAANLFLHACPS
jgi:ATP synthase F1 complex assembly factor 2